MEKSKNQLIYSVSDLISVVNQTLDYAYPSVIVEGEVSEFKVSQNKWVYFKLKDSESTIECFMTLWQLRMPIQDGMEVTVEASPKLTKWGKFSLTIRSIRPRGEGAIKKSYELLKEKLETEGLFAPERKRQLPSIPSHVAVISSTQAAGYADFIKILNDRWGGIKVDVAHVQVQGQNAPDQIIQAINYFNQLELMPEVVVIIRGGGSADDLAAFNDEQLVRTVASSRIPTLIGVGHETDTSLVDLAADVSASTPSNAAQVLAPDRNEIIRSVKRQIMGLLPRILQVVEQQQKLLNDKLKSAINVIDEKINEKINYINQQKRLVNQFNPNIILSRGYALIRGSTNVGSLIEIETNKAILDAEVKNVRKK